jgi:hypothetical protein
MMTDLKFLAAVLFVLFFCVVPLFYMASNLEVKRPDKKAARRNS